jgi:hypothetical protein
MVDSQGRTHRVSVRGEMRKDNNALRCLDERIGLGELGYFERSYHVSELSAVSGQLSVVSF